MKIKAITLWNPWATEMREGRKLVETRSWATDYRGPLAIHAGRNVDREALLYSEDVAYPTGAVLGVVDLVDCLYMTEALIKAQRVQERIQGDWRPGRYAWVTRPLVWFDTPIPARGYQKLWDWASPIWLDLALAEVRR